MSQPPAPPAPNRMMYPALNALRTCLGVQLLHVGNPVCHLPLIWGDAPLPAQRCDCSCDNGGNGEGWVRLVRATHVPLARAGSSSRRNGSSSLSGGLGGNCGPGMWDLTVEAGVWRCALTLDATTGEPPSDADYDQHTQIMMNDAAALTRLWSCCEWLRQRDLDHQLDTLAPAGPSGGCVGTIATGRVRVEDCLPCP